VQHAVQLAVRVHIIVCWMQIMMYIQFISPSSTSAVLFDSSLRDELLMQSDTTSCTAAKYLEALTIEKLSISSEIYSLESKLTGSSRVQIY
jgi:hypothetical protein